MTVKPNNLLNEGEMNGKEVNGKEVNGKEVNGKRNEKENKTIGFDISEFETGIYIIQISADSQSIYRKIVKQ